MKSLVIYAHPNPESFNHAILKTVTTELTAKNYEFKVRDLYALNFDPVLKPQDFEAQMTGKCLPDVEAEKELITWADILIFVYPIWWTGLPAILKGYFDRILHHGFAYKADEFGIAGLLHEKKALLFTTCGTPENVYQANNTIKAFISTQDKGIFQFCGIEVLMHKFFGGVPLVDDFTRKNMLHEVQSTIQLLI